MSTDDREMLRALLREEHEERGEEASPPLTEAPGVRDRVWLPWAAAGLLFVLSLGMVWQVASMAREQTRLAKRVEALENPRGNVPLVYLNALTRSAPGPVRAAATDEPVVLIVTPEDATGGIVSSSTYELLLERGDGSEVWRGDGLTLSEHLTLRVSLPRLDPGAYRVAVRSVEADASVGDYRLEVR